MLSWCDLVMLRGYGRGLGRNEGRGRLYFFLHVEVQLLSFSFDQTSYNLKSDSFAIFMRETTSRLVCPSVKAISSLRAFRSVGWSFWEFFLRNPSSVMYDLSTICNFQLGDIRQFSTETQTDLEPWSTKLASWEDIQVVPNPDF